jgi:hypothetical protein
MGLSMRQGITVQVSEGDRVRLAALIADRNSPQKHVWRARIVLMTADGIGTTTIMRRTGKSKVTVWRWQERFMAQGVDGLLRDKTRPSRIPRLPATVHERTVALTQTDPPGEVTHWDGRNDGQAGRDQRQLGAADLAHPWAPAASRAPVQAVARSPVRHQAARHCRSLCRSTGACGGVVGRREIANPGARPHPARLADEEGSLRDNDP